MTSGKSAARRYQVLAIILGLFAAASIVIGASLRPRGGNVSVLKAASEIPNGGGYRLSGSGVPHNVIFKDVQILMRDLRGSHCSGFTFAVAMRAAEERGLLDDVEPYQIKRFQKEWYGATSASRLKQVVTAMENLGIGYEVYPLDARPGDFVVFSTRTSGHAVVFLDWIKRDDGTVEGVRYRSSQPATNGVGEREQYFTTSTRAGGNIIPKYFFVGRLDS